MQTYNVIEEISSLEIEKLTKNKKNKLPSCHEETDIVLLD